MAGKKRGHGEGLIRQRAGDGLWEARISLPGGKSKSLYAKTRQEVARKLAHALRDIEQGLPVKDERQTVATYLASWLETIEPTLRESTTRRHRQFVEYHILPALGKTKLAQLSAQQVQAFYARKLHDGLSTTTVNHLHATLHKALTAAVRLGLIARNVSEMVQAPRMRHVEMHVLSADEVRTLLATSASNRQHALYVTAIATGMRQGELLGLRWRDVDLDGGVVRVRSSLMKGKSAKTGDWVFSEPKTRRSRRQIALAAPAVTALRAHRQTQRLERMKAGPLWQDGYDLVFCTEIGGPLSAGNVYTAFQRLLKRAGLSRIRFHDLRHTCATLMLSARVNPKVVSEMLGHASVAITLDIYSHVLPNMQQDAAAAMGNLLVG